MAGLNEPRAVADQVNRLGPVDAVIDNAGVLRGPHVLPVNVVATYLLPALIHRPQAADVPHQRHALRRTT